MTWNTIRRQRAYSHYFAFSQNWTDKKQIVQCWLCFHEDPLLQIPLSWNRTQVQLSHPEYIILVIRETSLFQFVHSVVVCSELPVGAAQGFPQEIGKESASWGVKSSKTPLIHTCDWMKRSNWRSFADKPCRLNSCRRCSTLNMTSIYQSVKNIENVSN